MATPTPASVRKRRRRPPPAVATKLYPPRPRATDVARTDLVALLGRDARRVTVVVAPAGSGKSTLVAQWLARAAIPSAWVTPGVGDGHPHPFFALVVAALNALDPGLVAVSAALMADQRSFDAEGLVRRLATDLSASLHPFALVLDDYHVVTAETHRAVELLLAHAPPALRVVLVGRSVPALRSARERDNPTPRRLGSRDLAFAPSETTAFLRQGLGLDLAPSEVEAIHHRTHGWPVGLHVAGIAVRPQPHARVRSVITDFDSAVRGGIGDLWDRVIRDLPADLQAFLLLTSHLDRFTAELCDAVTGMAGSERHIRRCVRDGLFVLPLDEVGAWYRYHDVFAEALRDRLASVAHPDEGDRLHRRAARWLADHGHVEEAVRHAVAGRDWDGAVALLEEDCAPLFARDHVATLRDRLQGLPSPVFARSPRLAFWSAWALGRLGHRAEAMPTFRIAEDAWAKTGDPAGRGASLLWKACFALDDGKAIAATEEALALLPEDRPAERIFALSVQAISYLRRGEPVRAARAFADERGLAETSGLEWFGLQAMAHEAGGLIQRGRLREAAALCRRVVKPAGPTPVELWVQAALYRLGSIHYEWGRLDAAVGHLRRADELAELTGSIQWRARICVGLARLSWARGDHEQARGHLDRALDFAIRVGTDQPVRDVKAWQARGALAANDLDRARRWAEESGVDPSRSPEYDRQIERLTYVRFLVQDGRPDLALAVLDPVSRQARAAGRDGDLVELAVLEALAFAAAGSDADARRSLRRALALGRPEGYARVFADEGEALAALLRRAAGERGDRAYARRLLAEVEAAGEPLDR